MLNNEAGANEVQAIISTAAASAVNVAEVASKLADHGLTDSEIRQVLEIGFDTLPFGSDEIAVMPKLRRETVKYGLSLGDRCCLATALVNGGEVITADRAWARVAIPGLKITVLQERSS